MLHERHQCHLGCRSWCACLTGLHGGCRTEDCKCRRICGVVLVNSGYSYIQPPDKPLALGITQIRSANGKKGLHLHNFRCSTRCSTRCSRIEKDFVLPRAAYGLFLNSRNWKSVILHRTPSQYFITFIPLFSSSIIAGWIVVTYQTLMFSLNAMHLGQACPSNRCMSTSGWCLN